MTDTVPFAEVLAVAAAVGLAVLAASRLSERIKVPLPAPVLVAAAVAVAVVPGLHAPSRLTVSRIVTVALVAVLFHGGMHMGRHRFRSAAAPILVVGVAGTLGTAALGAVLLHVAFGLSWYVSLLVGTAVAPTDPTVVFSVLGRRQVSGRSGTILEGESGANDPVGIALMAGLLGAGHLTWSGAGHVVWTFALQMIVGAAVGVAGGKLLLVVIRRIPLPGEGLYPLRTLASALLLYGAAAAAHGSGFLAVFAAGIVVGDERAPYKREIERFHGALASLGEIVAFIVLGLTVHLHVLAMVGTWGPGIVLAVALALAIRPFVVGLCLWPTDLPLNQSAFVQLAGLKGAVPILLGSFLLGAHLPDSGRLYGIVVIVVIFSVVAQGGTVSAAARMLSLPMQLVEPEPWTLGVRLRTEPDNVHEVVVAPGSAADGCRIAELEGLPEDAWVTLLVRKGRVLPARGDTELMSGDRVTILAGPGCEARLQETFRRRRGM